MDESAALRAFQDALRTQRPEFGQFFLARLLGLDISYPDGQCLIVFDPRISCSIRRAACTAASSPP